MFYTKNKILFCYIDHPTGLRAEEWVKDARNEARAEADSRSEIEKMVGHLKEDQAKLSEQLKEAIRARDSSDVGLKNAEKKAEEQRK